jgi:hypothetical protein
MMRRGQQKPHKPAWKVAKEVEMAASKRRFAMAETFPAERFCQPCRMREPWVDICPECFAKVQEWCR